MRGTIRGVRTWIFAPEAPVEPTTRQCASPPAHTPANAHRYAARTSAESKATALHCWYKLYGLALLLP
eukprot:1712619-Rhodomonas_salina.1